MRSDMYGKVPYFREPSEQLRGVNILPTCG